MRWGDPHHSQPAVLSLTQPTDMGTIYSLDEIDALIVDRRRERELRVHIDGARVANALAALGCSPADLTWRAGVDVLSLGATKNGALSAEAIVAFDDDAAERARVPHQAGRPRHVEDALPVGAADRLPHRRARGCARPPTPTPRMAELASGLARARRRVRQPARRQHAVRPRRRRRRRSARAAGLLFYRMGRGAIRLVTSWQTTADDVDGALAAFAAALG